MKIIDYKIVKAATSEDLEMMVKSMIQSGWQAIGPAAVTSTGLPAMPIHAMRQYGHAFIQTMVKYSD